jgi:endo-1,4-beta-xylanase
VRAFSLKLFVLTVSVGVAGCGSTDTLTPPGGGGGDEAVGGSTGGGDTSMVANTGGSAVATTGGFAAVATGGNAPATGGSVAETGGSPPATGGFAPATGGSKASAAGGTKAAGTGGAPQATGGTQQTDATGGRNPTGGRSGSGTGGATTGTGGKSTTGGAVATGGSKQAGGAAPTTGGSTAAPTTTAKFVGNITTGNSVDPSGLKFYKYWDQISPENQGKWGSVQSSPTSAFNWGSLDSIYSYTQTNHIIFKLHCFFWGAQQPNPASGVTLAIAENWVKSFCQRFPETKVIDVVNEPPPHTTPGYTSALGAGESGSYPWITKAFKLARQYCPNAILLLNDYNNIEWSGNQDTFVNIVKDIKANGAPIDAVGAQAHDLDYNTSMLSTVTTLLPNLNSKTGLPVYITEMDLNYSDDAQQLTAYQQFFPLFADASYVKGITIWGWIYGSTWSQAPNSGLVRGTSPRSAMTWLMTRLGRPIPPN